MDDGCLLVWMRRHWFIKWEKWSTAKNHAHQQPDDTTLKGNDPRPVSTVHFTPFVVKYVHTWPETWWTLPPHLSTPHVYREKPTRTWTGNWDGSLSNGVFIPDNGQCISGSFVEMFRCFSPRNQRSFPCLFMYWHDMPQISKIGLDIEYVNHICFAKPSPNFLSQVQSDKSLKCTHVVNEGAESNCSGESMRSEQFLCASPY